MASIPSTAKKIFFLLKQKASTRVFVAAKPLMAIVFLVLQDTVRMSTCVHTGAPMCMCVCVSLQPCVQGDCPETTGLCSQRILTPGNFGWCHAPWSALVSPGHACAGSDSLSAMAKPPHSLWHPTATCNGRDQTTPQHQQHPKFPS